LEFRKHTRIKALITGAKGFIGKNLVVALRRRSDVDVVEYDIDTPMEVLKTSLTEVDVIYHLAGVNRPDRVEAFGEINFDLTVRICDALRQSGRSPLFVLSSSTQAALDNPYGISKRQAEETVFNYGRLTSAQTFIFRLPGVFGKWCRPNYNSVVATFCHNIANGFPITVSDPVKKIDLVYIDDVLRAFVSVIDDDLPVFDGCFFQVTPMYQISLGALADMIRSFGGSRDSLIVPEMSDPFTYALYGTYISYLPAGSFAYSLKQKLDPRGQLAELLKSPHIGQIFISRTRPGITRGHHYHDTKVEKFVVLEGEAIIRFRPVFKGDVIEYSVSGHEFRVVDIPPGYAHSIENVGQRDLIVLFWADEVYDEKNPDTFGMTV